MDELSFEEGSKSYDRVIVHNLSATSIMFECGVRLEVGAVFRLCLPPNPLVTITWTNGSMAIGEFDLPLPFKTLCLSRIKSVVGPDLKLVHEEANPSLSFGRRFHEARLRNQMTQREVAKALRVTTATVCWWESGRSLPNEKRWAQIEACLGVSMAESLQDVVRTCRERIAKAAGTAPQDVTISVNI